MSVGIRTFAAALGLFLLSVAVFMALPYLKGTETAPWPPFTVRAAGGPIRIVETGQRVNYPSGVGVTITVESDAAISEVRVYYRPAGSRQWGYAYADFEPSTNPGARVVATQSIPVRDTTYIAPGADVEYFYEIRDVQGNVFRTEKAIVEYLDQRFNWRRMNIGPLELVYQDINDSEVKEAAKQLREDLRRVEELLRLDQPDSFKGVIYKRYADANAAFPVQSQTTTDHGTFAGYAFPEQGVFVGQGLDRRIIVHESVHLMFRDALGDRAVNLPDWLNEGFATYMEPNVRVRSSGDLYSRTPPLPAMQSLSGTPETIPLFYHKSVSVVAHLIEKYGEDSFHRLLGELGAGRTIETALINVYGFDQHGLDSSWAGLPIPGPPADTSRPQSRQRPTAAPEAPNSGRKSDAEAEATTSAVRAEQSTPALPGPGPNGLQPSLPTPAPPAQRSEGPSPFLFIDVWVLTGVALLAAAAVAFRFAYRRLRRRSPEPADSWRDREVPDWENE